MTKIYKTSQMHFYSKLNNEKNSLELSPNQKKHIIQEESIKNTVKNPEGMFTIQLSSFVSVLSLNFKVLSHSQIYVWNAPIFPPNRSKYLLIAPLDQLSSTHHSCIVVPHHSTPAHSTMDTGEEKDKGEVEKKAEKK